MFGKVKADKSGNWKQATLKEKATMYVYLCMLINMLKTSRKVVFGASNKNIRRCCSAHEKALRETQTLRAGCSKAEPKIFAPPQTPFPGAWDGQNLISCRWSLPLPTNPVWWGSMHAISSYLGNRPTNTHTHRQDQLQYTVLQLASVQCNYEQNWTVIRKLNMAGWSIPCLYC